MARQQVADHRSRCAQQGERDVVNGEGAGRTDRAVDLPDHAGTWPHKQNTYESHRQGTSKRRGGKPCEAT